MKLRGLKPAVSWSPKSWILERSLRIFALKGKVLALRARISLDKSIRSSIFDRESIIFERKMQKAFTLIELIIVAIIVVILASVALVQYKNVTEKSRSAEAYAVLADIASSESAYKAEYNVYTASFTALDRFDAAPSGQNFSFSTALDNVVVSGYVQAIFIAGKGSTSYYMCVNGGTKGTSPPSCP